MDIGDRAQKLQADEIERAVHAREIERARSAAHGRTICVEPGCDDPISATRQSMGATRCVECQTDHEMRSGRWASGR